MPKILSAIRFLVLCLAGLWAVQVSAQGLIPGGAGPDFQPRDAPLQVGIGIQIDQISFVDQKSENYGAVATIRAQWSDPLLAFDEKEYGRAYRVMKPATFLKYAAGRAAIAPGFVIDNQQSNRWIHQSLVVVHANGDARYSEKSSLTLQAPDFDFTKYPFDRQQFYFEIVSVFPSELVTYSVLPELSGMGEKLGEEEWILENAQMETSKVIGLTGLESDMVALSFQGRRHLMYYVIRIMLPMLVLVVVSWAVFFLDEYRKRIEIAGANLLMFIAFNWVISDDLPKLGYLTFLDFILQWMFVVSGAIVVFSVVLSRLKWSGREVMARRLDNYAVKWVYPLGYAGVVAFAVSKYLVIG
jgi:Neurotransmitter-gated ion-channel ligand binding domain